MTQTAQVLTVGDGDSLVVLQDGERIRVRLAEIDAPERGQPWSRQAREALRDKVLDKRVRLDVIDVDRYGRRVAHVWLGNRHINRELVREGHAWVYTRYLRDQSLVADEVHAREQRVGLWRLPEPVEPWRWRRAGAGQRESLKEAS
jgi:endonuclease YncB( thermonuclease family)